MDGHPAATPSCAFTLKAGERCLPTLFAAHPPRPSCPVHSFLLDKPSARAAMEAFLANPNLWLVEYATAFLVVSEAPLEPRTGLLSVIGRASGRDVGVAVGLAACAGTLIVHLWRRRRARRILL